MSFVELDEAIELLIGDLEEIRKEGPKRFEKWRPPSRAEN
jgi:hypothetical protein